MDANSLHDENTAKAEVTELIAGIATSNLTPEEIAEQIAAIYEPVFADHYAEGYAAAEEVEDETARAYRIVQEASTEEPVAHVSLSEKQNFVLHCILESSHVSDLEFTLYNEIANQISQKLPTTKLSWKDVEYTGTHDEADTLQEKFKN